MIYGLVGLILMLGLFVGVVLASIWEVMFFHKNTRDK